MKDRFFKYIHELQDTITSKLEMIDGSAVFKEDIWKRPEGGGGRTRVIENGTVFEKGGVAAELEAMDKPVWGRRSVFKLSAKPMLVCEVFLPSFSLQDVANNLTRS